MAHPATQPDVVVRGGRAVIGAPGARRVELVDLTVVDGRVDAVLPAGHAPAGRADLNADGLLVLPGAVDAHVHFDEPGREHWEGWWHGSRAAAAGGTTTVVDMPIDSHPPTLTASDVRGKQRAADGRSVVDFALWGGLTPGNVDQLPDLLAAGVVGLKAFACPSGWEDFPPVDTASLLTGLKACADTGRLLALHAELPGDHPDRAQLEPEIDVDGDPETAAVAWAAPLAAKAGARLHIVHAASADAVREALRWRAVSVETCPHYLFLDDVAAQAVWPAARCNPPIRDAANRGRLWEYVISGAVRTIASDHAPCPPPLRTGADPWAGVAGVQTALGLLLSQADVNGEPVVRSGVASGVAIGGAPGWPLPRIELVRLVELLTGAAALLGLPGKGALAPGYDADLVLVDPADRWTVGPDTLLTRHPSSPWTGVTLPGRVRTTLVRGRVAYDIEGPLGATSRALPPAVGRFSPPAGVRE